MTTTILVVDDSEDDQRLYRRAFKDFDCVLEMASTAEAGLARIEVTSPDSKRPDLILLDYNLPDMDGLSFIKRLVEFSDIPVPVSIPIPIPVPIPISIPIPIVMLTGENNAAVAVEAMKHGVYDYLVKDTEGLYLRLLPDLIGRVMAAHAQREQVVRLQQETEALLHRNRTLMQNSMDGIHVMDMRGNIVEANDAFCRMLGYTPEEMSRLSVADWDVQWSAEELRERFRELIGKSARLETVHRRKDRSLINVEISSSCMEIEGQYLVFAASRDITERKRAEEELKLSAQLLNSTSDSVFLIDLDGNFVYLNEAAWKSRGYTQDELMAMNVRELTTPEFSKLVAPRMKEVLENGYGTIESEHRCKDGSILSVEVSSRVIESGGRKLLLSASRDITERKKAEAALLQGEANLRAMLDNSPYMTWLKDTKGRYITINKVFADYLRLAEVSQAIGKTDLDLQPKELAEKYRADDAEVMAARKRKTVEESAFDGKNIHWVETSKTPIIDKQGNVLGTVGFARDITERKKAEEKLLQERAAEHKRAEILEQQFGQLLRSSFNEIYLFDAESLRFLQVSEGAKKNLGYSDSELQQLTPLDLKLSYSRKQFTELIAPLISGEQQSLLFETVHRRKDGTSYPVEVRLQLIASEPSVFVAVVQDITERHRAESQLREFTSHLQTVREEEKASVAREIHDDLGGTLAALKMDAYWLAQNLEENKEMLPLLDRVESMHVMLDTAVKAMRRIISDLRPTILDDFGLTEAIKWQCAQFQQRSGIECRAACIDGEVNGCENELDKTLTINLFRIVQEALTNVARHSGASRVEIKLHRNDEEVELSICDNGRGLPEGHTVATTSYGVRGMCERVKQLDGKIEFDSPPGGGFRITVILPLPAGNKR